MLSRVVFALVALLPLGLLEPTAAAAAAPAAVTPDIEIVELTSAAVADAREAGSASVWEVSGKRFAMVALRWTGSAPTGMQIQARRTDDSWTDWVDMDQQDGPDRQAATDATEPIWVGDSTAVRVRATEPAQLSVVLIDPGVSKADATPQVQPASRTAAGVPAPAVITRAGWGADESIRTECFARQGIGVDYSDTVKAAVIHHTVGTNNYSPADSARIVRGIYAFHAINRDWCDVGYNVLVDRYGQVFEGRFGGLTRPVWGAHSGGFNRYTFGVSMMGTFNGVAPTQQQLEAVAGIVAWKLAGSYRDPNGQVTLTSAGGGTSKYPAGTPVTLPVIFGHRDVGATECPGDVGYRHLPAIRERVTALMGNWTSSPVYGKWTTERWLGDVFDIEQDAADGGRWASFKRGNGTIYWHPRLGAHVVHGAIQARWSALGSERSYLGYPTSDEYSVRGGRRSDFQHGYITWNARTGAVIDRRY